MIPSPSPLLAHMVSQTQTPWWGVPLIAGAFLLLGGLLGGLISFLSARAADIRKAAREDEQRWDNELLERSSNLLSALDEVHIVNRMLQKGINDRAVGLLTEDSIRRIEAETVAAIKRFSSSQVELALIAPDSVVKSMTDVARSFVSIQTKDKVGELPSASPDVATMTAFIEEVRRSAGVPSFSREKQTRNKKSAP